jgi:hypothetical protein
LISVDFSLVLHEYILVAGLPLFVCVNVPIYSDVGVVEEGEDAQVIFAASVDVVVFERRVGSFVALTVDIVHGGVSLVELSIHIYSFAIAFGRVVV